MHSRYICILMCGIGNYYCTDTLIEISLTLGSIVIFSRNMIGPHHVLEVVQRARGAVRSARSARPEGRKARLWAGGPLRQVTARAAGGRKLAGGRRRFDESECRNKYVPALWIAHQLARNNPS